MFQHASVQAEDSEKLIYVEHVPAFAEPALESLYGSLYASLPQLRASDLKQVSTYVARQAGRLSALFLFRIAGRSLRVLNEGMHINRTEAERFASVIFQDYPCVDQIHFHAISIAETIPQRAALRFVCTEDMVIDLPEHEDDYMSRLGKATRKSLRRHRARAAGLEQQLMDGADANVSLIERIIEFNHARMAHKQRCSALDQAASMHLISLLRQRGIVSVISLHGQLCAGTLACRFGDDIYSLVNAHDIACDSLSMGNLSRHLMILAAIRMGARRFHLLGGHYASKHASLAERVELHHLTLYRDRLSLCLDAAGITQRAAQGLLYRCRVRLEEDMNKHPASWRALAMMTAGRIIRFTRHAWEACLRPLKTAPP